MNHRMITMAVNAVAIFSVALILLSSAPANPMSPKEPVGIVVTSLFPQGWRFFTLDPRTESTTYYRLDHDSLTRVGLDPYGSSGNYFGLGRRSRAQGGEAGLILEQLGEPEWTEIQDIRKIPETIRARGIRPTRVNNIVLHDPTLCGTIVFVQQGPIPWSWFRASDTINMPGKFLCVEVRCVHDTI